jgi:uncharacterized phiE125 gp8 family phage protein
MRERPWDRSRLYGRAFAHAPVRTVAPVGQPVTLAEAKAQCRVDHSDEDALLTSLIAAAVAHLDGYGGVLGRAILTQTWRQDFDGFAGVGDLRLRLPMPAASVASVTYVDAEGQTQTLASGLYALRRDAVGSFVEPAYGEGWPATRSQTASVSVTFTAGYGGAADVPQPIKQAILLLVGHWYANREAVTSDPATPLPLGVEALIAPRRVVGV